MKRPKRNLAAGERPVLTGVIGTNADLFAEIFRLYGEDGITVADVTYGRGIFWQEIDTNRFDLLATDIQTGIDFRHLPYDPSTIDIVVFDPPYMHGGATVKASINACYGNNNTTHESIIRLYGAGILEAARVLKIGGRIIIKSQDEIEASKQRLSHIEVIQLLELFGFVIDDIFVLCQITVPAMREQYQRTARKNHSYAVVASLRR